MARLGQQVANHGASFCVWTENVPQYERLRTASIGHFQCDDFSAAEKLLTEQCQRLAQSGFEYVVGPMEQNTWHSYRLVTESDGSPAFFLEPENDIALVNCFTNSGFAPIAHYFSSRDTDFKPYLTTEKRKDILRQELTIRSFDKEQPRLELKRLYQICLETFKKNFLYTPISEADFLALYGPIIPLIQSRYVLIAEDSDKCPQAFAFALLDKHSHDTPGQLIFKTYASKISGVGSLLYETLQQRAKEDGLQSVIHALMHENNISLHVSNRYANIFRRYALFGKTIST